MGKEETSLVHASAAELIVCPAAYCCERLEMLLYFPCPNALVAFPILFMLCHQSSNNQPCETLFPSLFSEVSTVLETGATSKKKEKITATSISIQIAWQISLVPLLETKVHFQLPSLQYLRTVSAGTNRNLVTFL